MNLNVHISGQAGIGHNPQFSKMPLSLRNARKTANEKKSFRRLRANCTPH